MLDRERAIKSLVRVSYDGEDWGMGVVVAGARGRYIVTAAHCVYRTLEDFNPLDHFPVFLASFEEKIKFHGVVAYMDPIADVALVKQPDVNDGYPTEWYDLFEELVPSYLTLGVQVDPPEAKGESVRFEGLIHTHDGKWVIGRSPEFHPLQVGMLNGFGLTLEKDQIITGGTSGSPVFGNGGRVLGIVSTSNENSSRPDVHCAAAWGALPSWAVRQLRP